MIEFLQITNDPVLARRCAALQGMRLFVDLERHGKAERQAGRNTFISTHTLDDVGRMRCALDQALVHAQDAGPKANKAHKARLMVRVNPLHPGSAQEVDAVLAQGADWLMLPMFHTPAELHAFSALVAGRAPIVALLETAGALHSIEAWVATPGLCEVFVGLNDLQLARQAGSPAAGAASAASVSASNPLRTSTSVEQALQRLFESHGRLYGGPVDALREVLQEVKDHEAALVAAMRAGTEAMLAQLSPGNVADQFEQGRARTLAPGQDRRPRYWEYYAEFYRVIAQSASDGLPHPFAEAFSRAYEGTRAGLRAKRKGREA